MAKKRILIVEDDEFLAEIYSRQFQTDGFDTEEALNGEEAEKVLNQKDFDIVLLDIMLPKVDGLTILEEIRKNPKTARTPVVVMSNLSQDSTIKQALSLGANGFLVKAEYLPPQIVSEVKKYLS
jgi:two-component system alkaline phosphatase synthesis response regulator PhoP